MGIVDRHLETFELESYGSCTIEYNTNGIVHLHLGAIRVELSPEEFDHFATVVANARDALVERKDLQKQDLQKLAVTGATRNGSRTRNSHVEWQP